MARIESYSVEYEEGSQPFMTVLIRLDRRDPVDVVVEKIAASLPKGYQRGFAEGKGRAHPFEGPEVFDDEPRGEVPAYYVPDTGTLDARILAEAVGGAAGGLHAWWPDADKISSGTIRADRINSGSIRVGEITADRVDFAEFSPRGIDKEHPRLRELFEAKRAEASQAVAEGEGDWLLNDEDKVGDDE